VGAPELARGGRIRQVGVVPFTLRQASHRRYVLLRRAKLENTEWDALALEGRRLEESRHHCRTSEELCAAQELRIPLATQNLTRGSSAAYSRSGVEGVPVYTVEPALRSDNGASGRSAVDSDLHGDFFALDSLEVFHASPQLHCQIRHLERVVPRVIALFKVEERLSRDWAPDDVDVVDALVFVHAVQLHLLVQRRNNLIEPVVDGLGVGRVHDFDRRGIERTAHQRYMWNGVPDEFPRLVELLRLLQRLMHRVGNEGLEKMAVPRCLLSDRPREREP